MGVPPKSSIFIKKKNILGYPHFRKPPNIVVLESLYHPCTSERHPPRLRCLVSETNAAKNPPREEKKWWRRGVIYKNKEHVFELSLYIYISVDYSPPFFIIFPVIRNIMFLLTSCRLLQNEEAGPRCADFTSKEKKQKDQMRHRL